MIVGDLVDAGVAEIRTGPFGTQLKASDYVETGRPVLNVRNVGFGDVRSDKLEYIDEETAERLSGHLLQRSDIVFGRKGAVERHAFIRDEFVGALQGSDCIRLRLGERAPIRAHFASFALRTIEHQAWMQAFCSHGATMASLNQDILRQIRLPDLPLAGQDAVIEVLGAIDDLIENNRRRVELSEEMARAIYREWFVRFRYPGHEDVPLVDSPLGPIPDGWEVRRLDEAASLVRGRSYRKHELVDVGGRLFVNLKCMMRGGGFRRDGLKRYDGKFTEAQLVGHGDVVLAVTDLTQGREILARATLVPRLPEPGVISLDVARIVPDEPADRLWLFAVLRWSDFADRVKEFANGSTVLHLSPDHVAAGNVLWPPGDLRALLVSALEPSLGLVDELLDGSDRLALIRDLLLPKLVTGQIDVSHLDLGALTEVATA
jgi:type I restriction enzyme S subunit